MARRWSGSIETQRGPYLLDLVDIPVQVPQGLVVGAVAVPGAELVVVVELDARIRQPAVEDLEVLMEGSWTAVQQEDLETRVVADPLGPDAVRTGRRADRDHPGAVAEDARLVSSRCPVRTLPRSC
jgi:hypothetical protein